MKNTTVICNRCGEVVYENEEFKKCLHITTDEIRDFYKYLDNQHEEPIIGNTNKG